MKESTLGSFHSTRVKTTAQLYHGTFKLPATNKYPLPQNSPTVVCEIHLFEESETSNTRPTLKVKILQTGNYVAVDR